MKLPFARTSSSLFSQAFIFQSPLNIGTETFTSNATAIHKHRMHLHTRSRFTFRCTMRIQSLAFPKAPPKARSQRPSRVLSFSLSLSRSSVSPFLSRGQIQKINLLRRAEHLAENCNISSVFSTFGKTNNKFITS